MFGGLNRDRVMFSGYSISAKKLSLLHDSKSKHYNVITNLKGAMAKRDICNGCYTLYDYTHKYDKVCYQCTATPTCTKGQTKHFDTCTRRFLSKKRFRSHLTLKVKGNLVCQWRKVCRNCSYTVTIDSKDECFKKFCNY